MRFPLCDALRVLIWINFDYEFANYQSLMTLVIAVIFMVILVPMFSNILLNLQNEIEKETEFCFNVKNQFKRMFDSLQEGIVVLSDLGSTEYKD